MGSDLVLNAVGADGEDMDLASSSNLGNGS